MRLLKHNPRDKSESWRACKMRQQQHRCELWAIFDLRRSYAHCWPRDRSKCYSNVTRHVRFHQSGFRSRWWSGFDNQKPRWGLHSSSWTTKKRQRRVPSVGAVQSVVKLFPTTLQKGKINSHNRSVAPLFVWSMSHWRCATRFSTIWVYSKRSFWVLMDWIRNAWKATKFSVLRVFLKHLSIHSFLQASMIQACYRLPDFLSMENVESFRRIGLNCAAFYSGSAIFSEFLSCNVANTAIICESSDHIMSSLSSKTANLMRHGFAVLFCWADASAFPKEVLPQLNAPSTFSKENLLELRRFFRFIFPGKTVLRWDKIRTLWTIPCMLVLPQWSSEAPKKALRNTRWKLACCKTIWMRSVLAYGLRRDEHSSTCGTGGLLRCSICKAHTMKSFECRIPAVDLYWLESVLGDKVDTITVK